MVGRSVVNMMERIDAPNGRFYIRDGEYYPSVTTILDKVLAKGYYFKRWLGNQPSFKEAEEYKNEKAEKGTKIHEYCDRLARGETIDVSGDSKEVVKKTKGYVNFHKQNDVEVIDTEFQVYHPQYKYAGTADLLARVDGEEWLIDIKTSSNIYDSHKLQLVMYNRAIERTNLKSDLDFPMKTGILLLKDRTKKGYQLKEVEYKPWLVHAIVDLYKFRGDMEPEEEEKLPEELALDE